MEERRIRFLIDRDGIDSARETALYYASLYRTAVLKNGNNGKSWHFASSREYRKKFIESYLHLKQFHRTGKIDFDYSIFNVKKKHKITRLIIQAQIF